MIIRNPPSQVSFNTAVSPSKYHPSLATCNREYKCPTCRGCPDPCGPRARGGGGRAAASCWRGAQELRSCTTELGRSRWGTEQWLRKSRACDPDEQYLVSLDRRSICMTGHVARNQPRQHASTNWRMSRGCRPGTWTLDTRDRMISD